MLHSNEVKSLVSWKRTISFTVFVILLIFGIRAVVFKFVWPIKILSASKDLPRHSLLVAQTVKIKHISSHDQVSGMIVVKTWTDVESAIANEVTNTRISAEAPILSSNLINISSQGGPVLPPGTRGYFITLENGVRLIAPGDHVDVVRSDPKNWNNNRTPIVQNVLVVAVGRMIGHNGKIINSKTYGVTLAVKPEQAELLANAERKSKGNIMLIVLPR